MSSVLLDRLPSELQLHILRFLDSESIVSLLQIPQLASLKHLFTLVTCTSPVQNESPSYFQSKLLNLDIERIDIADGYALSRLQKIKIPLIEISTNDLKIHEQTVKKLFQWDNLILVLSNDDDDHVQRLAFRDDKARLHDYYMHADNEVQRIVSLLMRYSRHIILRNFQALILDSVSLDPFYHTIDNFYSLFLFDCSFNFSHFSMSNQLKITNINHLLLENPSRELIYYLNFDNIPNNRLKVNYSDGGATTIYKDLKFNKVERFEILYSLKKFENIKLLNAKEIKLIYCSTRNSSDKVIFKNIFAPNLLKLELDFNLASNFEISDFKTSENLRSIKIKTDPSVIYSTNNASDFSFINNCLSLESLSITDIFMNWEIRSLNNLKSLELIITKDFIDPYLQNLPLLSLKKLKLIIDNRKYKELNPIINASNLEFLRIDIKNSSPLLEIKDFTKNYSNLRTLEFINNTEYGLFDIDINNLPNFTNLESLMLSRLSIISTKSSLNSLLNLRLIDCFDYASQHFLENFGFASNIFPNVKHLELVNNTIERIGRISFEDLIELEVLTIHGLSSIELSNLPKLTNLYCSQDTEMVEILNRDGLPSLEKLYYFSNRTEEEVESINFKADQSIERINQSQLLDQDFTDRNTLHTHSSFSEDEQMY